MCSPRLLVSILLSLLVVSAGCLGPRRSDYVTSTPVSVEQDASAAAFWEGVEDALHDRGFKLDRVDRRAGIITTLPVTSQQFFEFWRHDVDTREDLWEATFNSIRRRVEVTVSRGDGGVWSDVSVVVYKQRYSAPDRQFNSTGELYEYFGTALPTTTGEIDVGTERDRWIDIGRDPAMAAYVLDKIIKRTGAAASAPTGDAG